MSKAGIHLLCVGVSRYGINPLSSPAASALHVFQRFKTLSRLPELPLPLKTAELAVAASDVELELVRSQRPQDVALFEASQRPLTRADLDQLLDGWTERVRVGRDDIAVFYFSGHGLGEDERPGEESKTLLLASDFDQEYRVPPKAVAVQHLLSALQPSTHDDPVARSQLLLLDCCRERTWFGPPAEQGELRIRIADRRSGRRAAPDDRRLNVHYACCAGAQAWSAPSDLAQGTLAATNYGMALDWALDSLKLLPELRVQQLLTHVERALAQKFNQSSWQSHANDFPMRVSADPPRPAAQARVVAAGTRADSRAPTALVGLTADLSDGSQGTPLGPSASLPEALAGTEPQPPIESLGRARSAAWLGAGLAVLGVGFWALAARSVPSGPTAPSATGAPASAANPGATGSPTPAMPALAMTRLPPARLEPGSSKAAAEHAYAQCIEHGKQLGFGPATLPKALPCSKPFEASQYTRELWPVGPPVNLESFELDRLEVTTAAFAIWLNEIHDQVVVSDAPERGLPWVARQGEPPMAVVSSESSPHPEVPLTFQHGHFAFAPERATTPITFVSWHGADRYCHSLGKRLPSELEWEYAARGSARRETPWQGPRVPGCQNVTFGRSPGMECAGLPASPSAVGSSPLDLTPEGIADLAGNVSEWTATVFTHEAHQDDCGSARETCRVVRGGGFIDSAELLRGAFRGRLPEQTFALNVGFRCAR